MAWIYPDVPRNVHGDSRHSGSCDVAAEYPGSFVDIAGRDELDPDVLSARRDHRHPSKWLDHPGADVALVVCDRDLRFHAGLCRVRLQWQFRSTRGLPGSSGLRRRHAHPGGLFGRIPAFPHSSASGCDHDRGGYGGSGSHRRSCGRRLDQRDLVLAVAIPDQCRARDHRRCCLSFLLPRAETRFAEFATLDILSLALMIVALASLEIGLKEAPHIGWLSPLCSVLFLASAAAATAFTVRSLKVLYPVVEVSTLRKRSFAIGCGLSFCLGVGLFGSVYLMPVFLAYVRRHDAFEIGSIMLVTGEAQLVAAPLAGRLESRLDPRWLSAVGFALFAAGLAWSAFQSRVADFDEMFWPQVLRGVAIMFCLLPPVRLALGALTEAEVPNASGLFNLMRNLGGAIGIALIDSLLYGRSVGHAEALRHRLIAGDVTAAQAIGLDLELFLHRPADVSDATVEAYVRPLVEKAAFALSSNEAWIVLACAAFAALLLIPFAGAPQAVVSRGPEN